MNEGKEEMLRVCRWLCHIYNVTFTRYHGTYVSLHIDGFTMLTRTGEVLKNQSTILYVDHTGKLDIRLSGKLCTTCPICNSLVRVVQEHVVRYKNPDNFKCDLCYRLMGT